MKRSTVLFLGFAILLSCIPAYAYEPPHGFWEANANYESALKAGRYSDIIKYGNQVIAIMQTAQEGQEKKETLVTRYHEIAQAYAALGNYDSAKTTYQALVQYAGAYGDEFYDYIRPAKEWIRQYTPTMTLYTDNGSAPNYGAKNEKSNGVLFGLCANGATRSELGNESMILTYQELGQHLLDYNVGVMRQASSSGCAVELALNCPNEGKDIQNVQNMTSYLQEISDMLKQYSGVPVYLRFAAEFDIWSNRTDPETFKSAFRYVSSYFHGRNSNVAMVWSPTQASAWKVDIDDYYPGDSYVDWVGISLYAERYFQSDKSQPEEQQLVFKTGPFSDPVLAIQDIVQEYGGRKPTMIAESGCAHRLVKSGEDTSAFALRRLQEYLAYLPMVYPQIKLMAYFDHYVESSAERPDFRLSTNTALKNEYIRLTQGARFIQDSYEGTVKQCYRPLTEGTYVENVFSVACYAHRYGGQVKNVVYYLDGQYAGMSDIVPFETYLDADGRSGRHTLRAAAAFSDGQTMTTETTINIGKQDRITVEIEGEQVRFDQEPILYHARTMVPMRKIFEELGAEVSWDEATQTATGRRGDRSVKVTVGSYKMYLNHKEIALDAPPMVLSNRTLVPARAVAEGMGCIVDWDGSNSLVTITPKVFWWSDWDEGLPGDIDRDLFYVEEKTEYRYREKELFESNWELPSRSQYVRTDISYGNWSAWQDGYISETEDREVETRTQSSPKKYHYAHWCTGNLADASNRYKTGNWQFCGEAIYHDLGWFDAPLPYSEDSTVDYVYYADGKKYRCSNTCYRWYLVETTGGDYTQYRSRPIERTYVYWQWGDWSDWTENERWYADDVDIDERTLYRYKEK